MTCPPHFLSGTSPSGRFFAGLVTPGAPDVLPALYTPGMTRRDGEDRASDGQTPGGQTPGGQTQTLERTATARPRLYRVLLLNDDYTPMDFVVIVLQTVFSMSREKATQVMLQVHREGMGVCGTYTREVAASKVDQVIDLARKHQHPLQCTMEET